MTKKEFLDTLKESLAGNIPASEVGENIRYYKDYIEHGEESEAKALELLGDPHLIARTVIDSFKISKGPMADFYTEQARDEYRKEVFDENIDSNTDYSEYGNENGQIYPRSSWFNNLILVLILIMIIAAIFVLGGIAIAIIMRVALPVLIIIIVFKFISNYFGKD